MEPTKIPSVSKVIVNSIKDSWSDIFCDDILAQFYKQYSPMNLKKSLEIGSEYFVTKSGGKIIAVGCLRDNHLPILFVKHDFQRKGIGTELYKTIERLAHNEGLHNVELEAITNTEKFYKHLGFKIIKKIGKEKAGKKYFNTLMSKSI